METIAIPFDKKEDRKIMAVKVGDEKTYHVPMPILGDKFHINGIIFKVTYQRDNPFRISAEPTGEVFIEVIESMAKAAEEVEKIDGTKENTGN